MTTENKDRLTEECRNWKELELTPEWVINFLLAQNEKLRGQLEEAKKEVMRLEKLVKSQQDESIQSDSEYEDLQKQLKEAVKEREELRSFVNDFMYYGLTVNPPICPDCNTLLVNIPILGISHICKKEMTEQNGGGE